MGLEEFGGFNPEHINKYSRDLLSRYGLKACEAADMLDGTNLAEGSISSYKAQVRQIISGLDDDSPQPEEVIDFVADCDKQSSTKNMMVMAMKKYYDARDEYTLGEKLVRLANESDDDRLAYSSKMEVKEWLTEDEIENIFKYILPDPGQEFKVHSSVDAVFKMTLEQKAIFATLYYTGLRVGEAILLKVDDFYFDENEVKVYRLKRQEPEIPREMIAVPEQYMDVMEEYFNTYEIDSGKVFDYTTKTIRNRLSAIDEAYKYGFGQFKHCKKLTPHKLRHSRVTAIANTSGLEAAGNFVSHASHDTTLAYRHVSTDEQRQALPEEQDGGDELSEILEKHGISDPKDLEKALSDD